MQKSKVFIVLILVALFSIICTSAFASSISYNTSKEYAIIKNTKSSNFKLYHEYSTRPSSGSVGVYLEVYYMTSSGTKSEKLGGYTFPYYTQVPSYTCTQREQSITNTYVGPASGTTTVIGNLSYTISRN